MEGRYVDCTGRRPGGVAKDRGIVILNRILDGRQVASGSRRRLALSTYHPANIESPVPRHAQPLRTCSLPARWAC